MMMIIMMMMMIISHTYIFHRHKITRYNPGAKQPTRQPRSSPTTQLSNHVDDACSKALQATIPGVGVRVTTFTTVGRTRGDIL